MISLRKHIDLYADELSDLAVKAFRSSLDAMARCGQRAIPPLGPDLNRKLTEISESLGGPTTPEILHSARTRMEEELSTWADRALHEYSQAESEMKEIVGAVARAAESVSQRDQKHSGQIGEVTSRLKVISEMNHLPTIRRAILDSAATLRTCVEQMAQDSQDSVQELSQQVEEYRARLRETERVSAEDPLTGLANRRAFDHRIETWIVNKCVFSLILIDLNGFKSVNDRYGHLAGDDLLIQFATELKSQFRPEDLVSRWGGDEFAVIVLGDLKEAEVRAQRIHRWVLGEYKLSAGLSKAQVRIGASIGMSAWNGHETGKDLLARADAAVYGGKPAISR
jgi:diguanylate cyclase (GGDEF)-like protein